MSKEALAKVVQRAISDASFRRQLSSDTTGALRGFDLTPDEVSALRAGDAGRLSTLGVDQRMSKSFALGGMAAATRMAQSDLTAGAPTAFDDGASGVGRTIIPHDPEAASTANLDGAGSSRAASAINDDPDGFLAANADATGGAAARASTINDDPDGFLAANANADLSGVTAGGGNAGGGTAFLDDSESHLTSIGYDPNAATSAVTDAHDRGGENIVTRIADDNEPSAGTSTSEGGPNISS